ncbi:MAG TPA: hypothetical protein PLW86_08970 [Rhodocyclaceae bacterium]|nr:hypothetical protein [Rhodocyclaceae bacterium]
MKPQIIYLHPDAPAKPPTGATCNGCGVCCAMETCPSGLLLFRQRRGPCPALRWSPPAARYFCGLLLAPEDYLPWLPRWCRPLASRFFKRWIAAGIGCDSNVAATPTTR